MPFKLMSYQILKILPQKKQAVSSKSSQKKNSSSSAQLAGKRINYSKEEEENEKMKEALDVYKKRAILLNLPNGMPITIENVANYYEVPKSTLGDRVKGKYSVSNPPSVGRKPVFTNQELADIVNHLLKMADIGYGYSPVQAVSLFRYLAQKHKEKSDFRASNRFLINLYSTFPELSIRKATSYEYQRAKFLTKEVVSQFFERLLNAYELVQEISSQPIDPKNVWSLDEVGFRMDDMKNIHILARKGSKNVFVLSPNDSSHITVIYCTNARGYSLDPFFVIKGNKPSQSFIDNVQKAGFYNSQVVGTQKAFVDFDSFQKYAEYFVKQAKFHTNDYSVLIMDRLKAHTLNLEALKFLRENNTFAVSISSHTSHVFNIGDRTVFGHMKNCWRTECLAFRREIKPYVEKDDFPLIFGEVWSKTTSQNSIIAGKIFLLN